MDYIVLIYPLQHEQYLNHMYVQCLTRLELQHGKGK